MNRPLLRPQPMLTEILPYLKFHWRKYCFVTMTNSFFFFCMLAYAHLFTPNMWSAVLHNSSSITHYNTARIVPAFTFPIPPNIPCSSKAIDLIYTKTVQEKYTNYKLFKQFQWINSTAFYWSCVSKTGNKIFYNESKGHFQWKQRQATKREL